MENIKNIKNCDYCKEEIIGKNYLGNEKVGYIHLACLAGHIQGLKL